MDNRNNRFLNRLGFGAWQLGNRELRGKRSDHFFVLAKSIVKGHLAKDD